MTHALAVLTAAVCLYVTGVAECQPIDCYLSDQCPGGFYCDPDVLYCRECLRCEDFKRQPLPSPSSCIKSVVECGPCNKGLVEDHRGDVNAQCVPPSERHEDDGFPIYGWVLVAILVVVVLALFAGIGWYVLKHPDTLKILASTSTSMQSRYERTVVPPTAPDQPPPYRALYTEVQPISPSPPPPENPPFVPSPPYNEYHPNVEDSSQPFIKQPTLGGDWSARESAGSQAARVYNNPAYVRGGSLPTGYESTATHNVRGPKITEEDEDTMESTWTPAPSADQNDNMSNGPSSSSAIEVAPSSSQLPALLAAARTTSLVRAPQQENALQPYIRQDLNNNGSRSHGDTSSFCGEGDSSSTSAQGGSSFIINVIQNINTLPQRTDVGH